MLKRVRDLELETDTLKNYIIELKARVAVYVPIKDDPVDVKIAEFINNYPDRNKLKIMFMRESSGVYEFGSKKVTVRVEGNKIQIRVGGGFLTISEFVAINCGNKDASEQDKKRITNLVYAGKCAGNKEFKTFYMSQHTLDECENPEDTENVQDHQFVVEKRSKSALTGGKASRHAPKGSIPSTPQGNSHNFNNAFNACSSFNNTQKFGADSPGKNARRF